MSMGAGSLPRPLSRWSGHLSAADEVLVLQQCWGDGCAPARSLGVPPVLGRTLLPAPAPAPTISQLPDPTGAHQEQLLLQAGPVLVCSLLPSPVPWLFAGRVLALSQGTAETQDRGTVLFLSAMGSLGGREDRARGCHPFLGVKTPLAVEHSDC